MKLKERDTCFGMLKIISVQLIMYFKLNVTCANNETLLVGSLGLYRECALGIKPGLDSFHVYAYRKNF